MKATPLAAFAAFALAALCALAPGAASAQGGNPGRDNVYAVAGVYVDETAANSSAAQQAAFATAQRIGFERLVRRLTIPDELARTPVTTPDAATLDRLTQSTDVEEERRSATRYIGRLTVRFDSAGMRTLLRGQNLTVVDTRTAPMLVVPIAGVGTDDATAALWRDVWSNGGFQEELAPLVTAPANLTGDPDWNAAAPFAQSAAAASALYATLRVQGATATVNLVEVGPNGVRRDRGQGTARAGGTDPASMRAALATLAEQSSSRIQAEWKGRIATGGGARARVSASAMYASEAEWERIKAGLTGAAQTLISEIRIEAVGRQGALVSFSFVGDRAQLVAELARRGLTLQDTPNMGPVLRVNAGN